MRLIQKVFLYSLLLWSLHFLLTSTAQPKSGFQNYKETQRIIDDFLVNDDTTGGSNQSSSAIACNASGNYVVVWVDYRNVYPDIYAQRYAPSGIALGSNFKVNDNSGIDWQDFPGIAMSDAGKFVITWADTRNGWPPDIYAQRYASSGSPVGSNFRVNDDSGSNEQSSPAVALDNSGSFILTWTDERSGRYTWDIYAQKYNSSGVSVGGNFRVNDDSGIVSHHSPAIAADNSGDFVITWTDFRNVIYNPDIYAQRYNSSAIPLGPNFKVNDDSGNTNQAYPAIGMNVSGDFVITWHDERQYDFDVYAQRYNSSGTSLGSNFEVNDVESGVQFYPAVAMNSSGDFVITWEDSRSSRSEVYAQRYESSGAPLGTNFKANDAAEFAGLIYPAVAMDVSGGFVITWTDYRSGAYYSDIYAQRYNSSGSPLDSNFRVNDDFGSAMQAQPDISANASGDFVLVWEDQRNGNYDIYAQQYGPSGTPLAANFIINDSTLPVDQRTPSVAMDKVGNFVITWQDSRDIGSWKDIYAQRYSSSGVVLGPNFKVDDDTVGAVQFAPAIAAGDYGNFVIAWEDTRNLFSDIYAQRYDSSGYPSGNNFKVNDGPLFSYEHSAAVGMNSSGGFVVSWEDSRGFYPDIYAQRFDSSGVALGSNFKVNDDADTASQHHPVISMDGLGNFVIAWEDSRDGNYDIYAQRYDSAGLAIGSNFKENDDAGNSTQGSPSVAVDSSGNFVIIWTDERNGNFDIYAQRYDSNGCPVGSNYMVPNPQDASFAQVAPVAAANNFDIYFAWQDNRRAKSWDVYAKVVDWNWIDVKDDQMTGTPTVFELGQNYPNPFNPSTIISFRAVGSDHAAAGSNHITLKIYNILGQLVRTLLDEDKLPGHYRVVWEGKDDSGKEVASGVYFYQLKMKDYTNTKKMVLLR